MAWYPIAQGICAYFFTKATQSHIQTGKIIHVSKCIRARGLTIWTGLPSQLGQVIRATLDIPEDLYSVGSNHDGVNDNHTRASIGILAEPL